MIVVQVYQGIRRWLDGNNEVLSQGEISKVLKTVRLELIPLDNLLEEVRGCGLFEPNDILDAITMINKVNSIDLNQRGLLGKS